MGAAITEHSKSLTAALQTLRERIETIKRFLVVAAGEDADATHQSFSAAMALPPPKFAWPPALDAQLLDMCEAQLAIGRKEREYTRLELPAEMACATAIHVAGSAEDELDHPALLELLASVQKVFPSKVRRPGWRLDGRRAGGRGPGSGLRGGSVARWGGCVCEGSCLLKARCGCHRIG